MELSIQDAAQRAENFVEVAKQNGDAFDYSAKSIEALDDLLGGFFDSGNKPEDMLGTILVASCYLGEVFRRVEKAEWIDGTSLGDDVMPAEMRFPLMMRLDETYFAPYSKVYKRLENGAEDSLPFYFQVLTSQADMPQRTTTLNPAPSSTPKKGWFSRLLGKS
ncbi:hypothetical protein [Ascidiaceihabitans sp.]|uniref:hypothetical protein n=1 Tax=Ascidiaceihabitans sp. TaxID=1872644 RepID=UPI00329A0B01